LEVEIDGLIGELGDGMEKLLKKYEIELDEYICK
jgi:hypothetical protein